MKTFEFVVWQAGQAIRLKRIDAVSVPAAKTAFRKWYANHYADFTTITRKVIRETENIAERDPWD